MLMLEYLQEVNLAGDPCTDQAEAQWNWWWVKRPQVLNPWRCHVTPLRRRLRLRV